MWRLEALSPFPLSAFKNAASWMVTSGNMSSLPEEVIGQIVWDARKICRSPTAQLIKDMQEVRDFIFRSDYYDNYLDRFNPGEYGEHPVCGMRHAVCGMRHAACGMRHAASGMRHAVCGMVIAECCLLTADCCLLTADC